MSCQHKNGGVCSDQGTGWAEERTGSKPEWMLEEEGSFLGRKGMSENRVRK